MRPFFEVFKGERSLGWTKCGSGGLTNDDVEWSESKIENSSRYRVQGTGLVFHNEGSGSVAIDVGFVKFCALASRF